MSLDLMARLRATRAAALADPNTPPWRRMLLEAKPPPWWETENPPPPTVARTRKRKPTVASVIRQMMRAGVEIAGCEVNPRDGTVKVITGKPSEATTPDSTDTNEWDGVLQ